MLPQPSPEDIRLARKAAGLTQAEAASLISQAMKQPYRTWQDYEVHLGKNGHVAIPPAAWELFLLKTDQHPVFRLARRK